MTKNQNTVSKGARIAGWVISILPVLLLTMSATFKFLQPGEEFKNGLEQMGWTAANILEDKTQTYSGRTIELGDAVTKLDIIFREDEREIHLCKHLYLDDADIEKYRTLVKKIADDFDAELAAGKHQEHFGRVINETKRIMGY